MYINLSLNNPPTVDDIFCFIFLCATPTFFYIYTYIYIYKTSPFQLFTSSPSLTFQSPTTTKKKKNSTTITMKLFTASVFVGLASLVASDDVSDINDYFYGLDATDVAPNSCTSAA